LEATAEEPIYFCGHSNAALLHRVQLILFSKQLKLGYLMTQQRSDYILNGYCIYRKLVPENLIDAFLAEYQSKVAPSRDFFYPQPTQYERNKFRRTGYVENSFMNP